MEFFKKLLGWILGAARAEHWWDQEGGRQFQSEGGCEENKAECHLAGGSQGRDGTVCPPGDLW